MGTSISLYEVIDLIRAVHLIIQLFYFFIRRSIYVIISVHCFQLYMPYVSSTFLPTLEPMALEVIEAHP